MPGRLTNLHRFAPYYTQLARRAANKVGERLMGRAPWPIVGSRPPWVEEGTRLYVVSLGLTPSSMLTGNLYDRLALESLLKGVERGGPVTDEVGRIVTVELAVRLARVNESPQLGGAASGRAGEPSVGG